MPVNWGRKSPEGRLCPFGQVCDLLELLVLAIRLGLQRWHIHFLIPLSDRPLSLRLQLKAGCQHFLGDMMNICPNNMM